MIRQCKKSDFERVRTIINDAARAYQGIIPVECWKDPYLSKDELRREMESGVVLWGYEEKGNLVGVMGIQPKQDVVLIRHAYVCRTRQHRGIGGKLLSHLREATSKPILMATWADAVWAIRFYEKHGFRMVSREEGDRLQRTYWSTPEPQIKASVVLADQKWFSRYQKV